MANYHIHTFGCQMNFHDSENIEAMLNKSGHTKTEDMGNADIIIFNTCTIREKAYQKAVSAIGRLKNKKNKIIAICGCVAQQSKKELINQFKNVNIVCGPDQISKLPELISKSLEDKKFVETEFINDESYPFISESVSNENGIAYVTIIKGCNCKCAYCIVPSVRGSEVSRDSLSIIQEINSKIHNGTKEIILLGQNVNRYKFNFNFTSLLKEILEKTDVKRLRFVSPHPAFFDDDLINLFSDERLCPHVHLPVQSGSNKMLKLMKRGYSREKYFEIISKLRSVRPDIAIGTDIIVGFCEEEEKDYLDTIDLVEKVRFDSIFAFAYSPRPNTESFSWQDTVDSKIKNERLNNLLNIQENISKEKNSAQLNKIIDVLVMSKDPLERNMLKSRAKDNRTVIFAGNKSLIGNIVDVRVKDFGANSLIGELI